VKPITNFDDPRYVKALSHPLRVRILAILEDRTASPVQLAEWLDASLGVVSYHVRTLNRLGLVELVGETPRRGAVEHHYRARDRPTISAKSWEKAPPMAKQAQLGATLQLINEVAVTSAAAGGFDRNDSRLTRTQVAVDDEGWQELAEAFERLVEDVRRIERAATRRLERDGGDGQIRAGVVSMLFEAQRLSESDGAGEGDGARTRRRSRSAAHDGA
jgi:DNA-binding transcriptional ArsR family regulator